jgi:ERCC4-related helicase
MDIAINAADQLTTLVNDVLQNRRDCTISIINDKLTLSVFAELERNLHNVKEINLIIRDVSTLPDTKDIIREFEMSRLNESFYSNSYDIIEKNKLHHLSKARAMHDFIARHVNVRRTRSAQLVRGNILIIDDEFQAQGSSSLEMARKARKDTPHFDFDTYLTSSMDRAQILNNKAKFDLLWHSEIYTEDYKVQLLTALSFVYKEYSPELVYYFTLHELFQHLLDNGIQRFEKDSNNFKKSKIWSSLYAFQKDAVVSAIQKINRFNGCILADSVGLGKTFEALAVIKYYEMRQDNVLVLAPAKLYDNWDSFKSPYIDNAFVEDRFHYKILFHTDLSRTFGISKSGLDLARVDWSTFDLVVIDESHNFRNRIENDEHPTRYQRLMEEVLKKKRNTKVLLLSATPVNNSLKDMRNQISLITTDKDAALSEQGIDSISSLLVSAQKVINTWMESSQRSKNALLDKLPPDFFRLLEMLTISRSRKHITNYYGNGEGGRFPNKLTPCTLKPDIDVRKELLDFEATNEVLESLKLAVYTPMKYLRSEYREMYREKYQTTEGSKVLFFQEQREFHTAKLHRFNLFKRLESSVFAFGETLRRLLERIDSFILSLNRRQNMEVSLEDEEDADEEGDTLDYKISIKVEHLIGVDFLADLQYDKDIIVALYTKVKTILDNQRDAKLSALRTVLTEKITATPYNPGNRKVLVFSAYMDTVDYLYEQFAPELLKLGVHVAAVTGSGEPRCTMKNVRCEFNNVLRHFSPISKMSEGLPKAQQIDVLFATDCLSEGQNLQDCDTVVNYDIQWNPVVLIQRFGRIDRIGSRNTDIAMVNFFPNIQLNNYLQLEQRIQGKMMTANLGSTGDEHLLSPEMNDFLFRKNQLERLQKEVVDLEDLNENISIADLNMNDYLYELSGYVRAHPEVKQIPRGVFSMAEGGKKGCLFCFRHLYQEDKPNSDSSLYPYYLLYMEQSGTVFIGNANAREALKEFRRLCHGKQQPNMELFRRFNKATRNTADMGKYAALLSKAVQAIQGEEDKKAMSSIFDFGGYNNEFAAADSDDFELVSFLIVEEGISC